MSSKQLIILTLYFLFSLECVAQINCNFTADTTRTCAPKQIYFKDLSTSSRTIIYWKWDFGNGGFSNLKNPSRVYASPGVYTVTLTVFDGVDSCTVTKTSYLTLFKSPIANFNSLILTKCTPVEVRFTDNSTLGDAPIKSYNWDFGDLTTPGGGQTNTHLYKFPGTYSVVFRVTDTNGCSNTSSAVSIPVGAPKAEFTGSPRDDCAPPLKTLFNNVSTSRKPTSYTWLFGDGNTSTSKNPSNNYIKSGSFDVSLIVTDKYGCKDTLTREKYVNIGTVKADFIIPDTLCIFSQDSVINTSVGAKNFKWRFGNGATSTKRNPVIGYVKEGYTSITLVASSDTNCIDSITKNVYVEKVDADFNVSLNDVCKPNEVTFKDNSKGSINWVQYHLDMGKNIKDVYRYTKTISHIYPKSSCKKETWRILYTATSNNGCSSTKIKFIDVFNDQIIGEYKSTNSCIPADFTFDVVPCLRFPAVKWKWDFNTGNPGDTSNLKKPTNLIRITNAGSYKAKVSVTDSNGCVYSNDVIYEVGDKQTANFKMDKDTICFGEDIQFTNLSTDSSKITKYLWYFGDGTISKIRNPVHTFNSLGVHTVSLIVWNYTCTDTIKKDVFVHGPFSSILRTPNCKNQLRQSFRGNIYGGFTRHYWDFGDTTGLDSVNINVVHNYRHYNTYSVKLITINDSTGCKHESELTISPAVLKATIQLSDSSICRGGDIRFDGSSSLGNINQRYYWEFGDGQIDSSVAKVKHRYSKGGNLVARLVVVDVTGCSDTTTQKIKVSFVNAKIDLRDTIVCSGDTLKIKNLSTSDTTLWAFNWFLGTKLISSKKDLIHSFSLPIGTIDTNELMSFDSTSVGLYLVDFNGCSGEIKVPIKIIDVKAKGHLSTMAICRGNEIEFFDHRLPSSIHHFWLFGNGDSSSKDQPKYTYLNSGKYDVNYIVEEGGCSDTMEIPIDVQGIDSVGFTASLRDTTCYPATILFDDYSKGDSIKWRTWDFGDGVIPVRTPLKDSLTKTILAPGLFNIKLTVETSNGCRDSITYDKYIEIRGPYSRFSTFPDSICKYDEITFIHDTSNIYTHSLIWDFADGRVDSTGPKIDSLHHTYSQTGHLQAILLFSDSSDQCKKFFTKEIVVEEVIADFGFNPDSLGCEPFTAKFKDKSSLGDEWYWDFGSGNTSNIQQPEFTFSKNGNYPVSLIYSNLRNGCKDTVSKSVEVFSLPMVVGEGVAICYGDSAQLSASGAEYYEWSPNFKLSNYSIESPKSWVNESFTYLLTGTDSNNCENSSIVPVYVQQVPVLSKMSDTIIINGEKFVVFPKIENGSIFRWEPPTGLSCSDCPNPTAQPLESTIYTLYVSDSLGCFEVNRSFSVEVEPKLSLDVPDVFSPNGDGINDVISPAGWGLKEILEFKVFNRWGELVFESTKNEPGWNGYYKGERQNIETYVYFVKALSYKNEVITKEGYFNLVR